jgi:hypothetical protein
MKKRYSNKAEKQAAYRARKSGKPESEPIKETVVDEHGVKTPVEDVWDREKHPVREAWEIAVVRAQRARKYAIACAAFVSPAENVFQTVDWQYHNEGLPAVKKQAA